jgi:peptidylprolyl isomerase domain and WD repeat-containing protein 1
MRNTSGNVGKGEVSSQSKEVDPTIFVTSYKKRRFYLFTRRNPPHNVNKNISRDIFNEKPSREELAVAQSTTKGDALSNKVVICTTMGDIFIKLFPDETPKTCENFLTLCKNGYYDNFIFHRVIKGFMVQTGCPYGDGTGGKYIFCL